MKKLIYLIFITVLLGACKQVPNNKALINHNIFKSFFQCAEHLVTKNSHR